MPHSFLSFPAARARFVVLGLAALLATSGCTQLKGRQGYVVDPTLTEAITPGVDNRESVEKTLGRPTFVAQFGTNEYSYVSRDTPQLAFDRPHPIDQQVLRIRFAESGNAAEGQRTSPEPVNTK